MYPLSTKACFPRWLQASTATQRYCSQASPAPHLKPPFCFAVSLSQLSSAHAPTPGHPSSPHQAQSAGGKCPGAGLGGLPRDGQIKTETSEDSKNTFYFLEEGRDQGDNEGRNSAPPGRLEVYRSPPPCSRPPTTPGPAGPGPGPPVAPRRTARPAAAPCRSGGARRRLAAAAAVGTGGSRSPGQPPPSGGLPPQAGSPGPPGPAGRREGEAWSFVASGAGRLGGVHSSEAPC